MKANKLKTDEEINIWQPATDLMSSLLYIVLLVVLLLGLYILQIPETVEIDPDPGSGHEADGWHNEGGVSPTPTFTPDWSDDGGGGGGHDDGEWRYTPLPTWSPTVSPTPTPTPTWVPQGGGGGGTGGGSGGAAGPGDYPGTGLKSAVYVMLIDAETERTIKEANVQFELYSLEGALQILNTYYPERISYRSFYTTEAGTFYLPEKLISGAYELHEITEPEGYDAAPNQSFVLDDLYDWSDPYVVLVPVYPSRNVIRVQMTDAATGLPVAGGEFKVIANENVITPDGTLRYRAGETVSTIVCDENGYGVSDEIYLGEYTVQQSVVPDYYASLTETYQTTVSKKSDIEPPVTAIACERTTITLTLTDELYASRGIANAAFTVRSDRTGAEPFEVTTDSLGRIVLDQLDKGATYRIVQSSVVAPYRADPDVHTVSITAEGRIGKDAQTELNLTNRVIRVALGVTDEFSSVQVPDINLTLYREDGQLLQSWTTTGSSLLLETLEEGSYYLLMNGDTEHQYPFTVRDQAKIQTFNVHTTYVMQYVLLGVAAAALIGLVVGIVLILRARKKRKSN